MNGATAEPCVKTTRAPKSTSTSTIGPSHHFFRTRRKSQSSRANDGCAGRGMRQESPAYGSIVNPRGGLPDWPPSPGPCFHRAMELSMPLEEAMQTQRAIRRLKPVPVDDALVLHLIELALKAPTGSNAQSWEFVVVRDPAVKARLGTLNRRAWSLYGGIGRRLYGSAPGMLRIMDAAQSQADHFAELPGIRVAWRPGRAPP